MEIDGDTLIKVPVSQITSPVINKDLLDLHNQNLERALKYRSELLKSAQDLVKDLIEMLKSS